MEDKYLPEWKPWKVTAEELEKLRAKDRTAIDTFYFDNLCTLRNFAIRHYQRRGFFKFYYSVEEMLQEAYLQLYHTLDFTAPQYFYKTLESVFFSTAFGGREKGGFSSDQVKRDGFFLSI